MTAIRDAEARQPVRREARTTSLQPSMANGGQGELDQMSERQIDWARQHDWFVAASGKAVVVLEIGRNADGSKIERCRVFHDFTLLSHWAGY